MDDQETTDEKVQPKKKPPKKVYVPVKILKMQKKVVLIQYLENGKPRRVIVPKGAVKGGKVESEEIARSIPHGVPWEDFEFDTPNPEFIADEMRRFGIWTFEDLQKNLQRASWILLSAIGATRHDLVRFARDSNKKK